MPELTPHDQAIYQQESDRVDRMTAAASKREAESLRKTYLYGALILISLMAGLALIYMNQL